MRYRGDIVVRHKACPERRFDWAGGRWFLFVRNRLYIARKQGATWAMLMPRLTAYAAKGARNGLVMETLRAIVAAFRMDASRRLAERPGRVRAYLTQVDRAHRGGLLHRMRAEVLVRLPGSA